MWICMLRSGILLNCFFFFFNCCPCKFRPSTLLRRKLTRHYCCCFFFMFPSCIYVYEADRGKTLQKHKQNKQKRKKEQNLLRDVRRHVTLIELRASHYRLARVPSWRLPTLGSEWDCGISSSERRLTDDKAGIINVISHAPRFLSCRWLYPVKYFVWASIGPKTKHNPNIHAATTKSSYRWSGSILTALHLVAAAQITRVCHCLGHEGCTWVFGVNSAELVS